MGYGLWGTMRVIAFLSLTPLDGEHLRNGILESKVKSAAPLKHMWDEALLQ
jgi:hypothetical protein